MADFDEPLPDVQRFLREHAGAVDREVTPIEADEAVHRMVTHSLEPARRWTRTPAVVADRARRRPAVAAAVIAALLIGSLGGFAAGRGSAPKHATVAARGAAQNTETASTIVSQQGFAVAGSFGGSGGPGVPQMTKLFNRTTSDGVTLRGFLQDQPQGMPIPNGPNNCGPNNWCPPPECTPTSFFTSELSTADAVSQGGAQPLPFDGPATTRGESSFGYAEGAPATTFVVQTTGDVKNVRATWPDGLVDEMAPVQGWALVGRTGSVEPSSIVVELNDGTTVSLANIQGSSYPAQCMPPPPAPPELPPAGKEQPADAAAAKQGVTDAYQYVFTHGHDPNNNGTYIENADALKAPGDTVKQNFPQASDTVTVEVGEIRFLSTTEAALYFELKYDGGAMFGKQIGYAKLIDGNWKIEYDTMCMVLGWGGGQCNPPPDPARSTSAGNAPQPGTYNGPAQATATTTPASSYSSSASAN